MHTTENGGEGGEGGGGGDLLPLLIICSRIGGVFAFLTNEQSYKSLEATQTTINAVVDTGIDYATNTLSVSRALSHPHTNTASHPHIYIPSHCQSAQHSHPHTVG